MLYRELSVEEIELVSGGDKSLGDVAREAAEAAKEAARKAAEAVEAVAEAAADVANNLIGHVFGPYTCGDNGVQSTGPGGTTCNPPSP